MYMYMYMYNTCSYNYVSFYRRIQSESVRCSESIHPVRITCVTFYLGNDGFDCEYKKQQLDQFFLSPSKIAYKFQL